jgi:hypothetical protein
VTDQPSDQAAIAADAGAEAVGAGAGALDRVRALAADRPEVVVGAAFVGGLLLATILKRLGR